LRSRVDSLEARSAELEANQFSTNVVSIFAVNGGGFSDERIVDPTGALITDEDPNSTIFLSSCPDLNTSLAADPAKNRLDTGSDHGNDNVAGFGAYFWQCPGLSVKPPRDDQFAWSAVLHFTPEDFSVTLGPAIIPRLR